MRKPKTIRRNLIVPTLSIGIVLLSLLPHCACASSLDAFLNPFSVFEPKKMVEAYNNNLGSFFDVMVEGKDHSELDRLFEVALQSESDGEVIYANNDSSIIITYYSENEDTPADKMVFWTSSKSQYKNIPQLAFGWAMAMSNADGVMGLDFFQWLNESQDGDVYKSDPYNATYSIVTGEYSSFTLTRN